MPDLVTVQAHLLPGSSIREVSQPGFTPTCRAACSNPPLWAFDLVPHHREKHNMFFLGFFLGKKLQTIKRFYILNLFLKQLRRQTRCNLAFTLTRSLEAGWSSTFHHRSRSFLSINKDWFAHSTGSRFQKSTCKYESAEHHRGQRSAITASEKPSSCHCPRVSWAYF